MPEIDNRDLQVASDIGEIKGSLKAIEKTLAKLPCRSHGEQIAQLETRSAFFGAIGGGVVAFVAKILFGK